METTTMTNSVGGFGCWFKVARANTGFLEMNKELQEQLKEGSTEYWINYNYNFKEQWLDCDEEQDSFGIQGGYIYKGKSHY